MFAITISLVLFGFGMGIVISATILRVHYESRIESLEKEVIRAKLNGKWKVRQALRLKNETSSIK